MEGLSSLDFEVSRTTAFNACSALVVLLWDWLTCLDEEIILIWQMPRSAMYKWAYFCCRYVALACQSLDFLFVQRMEQHVPFNVTTCRLWLTYQGIITLVFLAIVEGLLMIRVYALWGRSKRIVIMLALFLVLEISCSVVSAAIVTDDAFFNELCLFKKPPILFVLFSVGALATQLLIVFLTVYKYSHLPRPCLEGQSLVGFVTREGSAVSLTIFALLLAGFVYVLLDIEYGDIMFYWILSALSLSGSRLVLSVHRFAVEAPVASPVEEPCFTSICIIEPDPII